MADDDYGSFEGLDDDAGGDLENAHDVDNDQQQPEELQHQQNAAGADVAMQDQPAEEPQGGDDDADLYADQQEQQHEEQHESQHNQLEEQHDVDQVAGEQPHYEEQEQQQADMEDHQQDSMQEDQVHPDDRQPQQENTGIVPRISLQNSEAADDNLLSGLADAEDEDLENTAGPPGKQQQPPPQQQQKQQQEQQPQQQPPMPLHQQQQEQQQLQQQEPQQNQTVPAAAAQDSTAAPDPEVVDEPSAAVETAAGAEPGPKLNARQRRQQQRQAKLKAMAEAAAAGKPFEDANGHAVEDKAPPSPVINSTILYIGNLHWWTTDAAVEAAISEYGSVSSCRFLEDRATGKSRGVAVVEFADTEAAKKCKAEFHGKELDGRAVVCTWVAPGQFAQQKGKGGFPGHLGGQHVGFVQQGANRGNWQQMQQQRNRQMQMQNVNRGGRGGQRQGGPMEGMNPAAMGPMGPMGGGFGGMNPAMMQMMMAQMMGRGMMAGPSGFGPMGPGGMGPGPMGAGMGPGMGPAGMIGGGGGGYGGMGDDEQDFKRQRR